MRFCEKCGNLLVVEKKRKNIYLVCRKCKRVYKTKGEKLRIGSAITEGKKKIIVMTEKDQFAELPKTKIICPKCENMEAYWWMQQTRSTDEPPTMFYRCTKCGYSWRSYG
ncbi:MAG: transcription factor S [Candidatus Aenigmatarchaeota archaeon]|nr:transcription factor S [Candidatus Aenigmarchaeota archaeon]